MTLPKFKYHIDPEENGVIEVSDITCICCKEKRGYIYTGSAYAIEDLDEVLCPWCIASGAAAKKYDVAFSDPEPLLDSGISKEIIEEVTQKNPGYISWQQECWLSHCNDACEFHGDASTEEVINASAETKKQWMLNYDSDEKLWDKVTKDYPNNDQAFYKFKCRHCSLVLLGWDSA